MKILIAGLLSVAFIWYTQTPPALTNQTQSTKVQTVQAVAPEKVTAVLAAAPTEPQPVVKLEIKPQGCEAYRHLISQYDWNDSVMFAVMRAESSCNPNAVNRHNYDGVYDYGLLQLHGQRLYEPSENVAAAYRLWKVQGYRAWSVYKSGAYLRFM